LGELRVSDMWRSAALCLHRHHVFIRWMSFAAAAAGVFVLSFIILQVSFCVED